MSMNLQQIESRIIEIKKQIADQPRAMHDKYKDFEVTQLQLDVYIKKANEPLVVELDMLEIKRVHLLGHTVRWWESTWVWIILVVATIATIVSTILILNK